MMQSIVTEAGDRIAVGTDAYFENWLGGTYTRVTLLGVLPGHEVLVVLAGVEGDVPERLWAEGLVATPDPALSYLPGNYGAS